MIITHEHRLTLSPVNMNTLHRAEMIEQGLKEQGTVVKRKESTTAISLIWTDIGEIAEVVREGEEECTTKI